jgi:DNA polymerase-1
MHDELIYEVREDRASSVAHLLKSVMEGAWRLKVPTPVSIKAGASWGTLMAYL